MCRSCLREDINHVWLLVVLEATCKSVPFRTSISRDCEVNVSEEIVPILRLDHRASDFCPVEADGIVKSTIQSTEIPLFWPKSFALNDNIAAKSVARATSGHHLFYVEHGECKIVLIVVNTVESQLKRHLITLGPDARRCDTDAGIVVPVDCHYSWGHVRNLRCKTSVKLQGIIDPWEIFTHYEDLSAACGGARIWEVRSHLSFVKVRKSETCVCPVETIQTDFKRNCNADQSVWRRLTDNPDSRVEVCLYDLVTKTAVRHNTVFRLEFEVVA